MGCGGGRKRAGGAEKVQAGATEAGAVSETVAGIKFADVPRVTSAV